MEHGKQQSLSMQQNIIDKLIPSKGNRNIQLESVLFIAIFMFCVKHGQSGMPLIGDRKIK